MRSLSCLRLFLCVKVGNLFQVQGRNLRGGSDLSLCTSLFVSCDHVVVCERLFFPPLIFARLPVHHMNTASHSKLVFPERIHCVLENTFALLFRTR